MGLKRGFVVEDTTPTVRDPRIRRLRLSTGQQVLVPRETFDRLIHRHPPSTELFFVERGFLGRTAWAGNRAELRQAVEGGLVKLAELGNLPAELLAPTDDLKPVDPPSRHGFAEETPLPASSSSETLQRRLQPIGLPPRPGWVADALVDADLASFVGGLRRATWGDWQLVHYRVAAIPRSIDMFDELCLTVGEPEATSAGAYATRVAVEINSMLLDHLVDTARSASDPRLRKTWLEILDAHDGPPMGALFHAVWAIALRNRLATSTRAEAGQPFARCVDPDLFLLDDA